MYIDVQINFKSDWSVPTKSVNAVSLDLSNCICGCCPLLIYYKVLSKLVNNSRCLKSMMKVNRVSETHWLERCANDNVKNDVYLYNTSDLPFTIKIGEQR